MDTGQLTNSAPITVREVHVSTWRFILKAWMSSSEILHSHRYLGKPHFFVTEVHVSLSFTRTHPLNTATFLKNSLPKCKDRWSSRDISLRCYLPPFYTWWQCSELPTWPMRVKAGLNYTIFRKTFFFFSTNNYVLIGQLIIETIHRFQLT